MITWRLGKCSWATVLVVLAWTLSVYAAAGQTIGLLDTRTPAYIHFSLPQYRVTHTATSAQITVLRTGDYRQSVSVRYATSDGTALAGQDYSEAAGVLDIPGGVGMATFNIPILVGAQPDRTINLRLLAGSPNTLLTRASAALIIVADVPNQAEMLPVLSIRPEGQSQILLSWRPGGWHCILEQTDSPATGVWKQVTGIVETLDGCCTVTQSVSANCFVYRLRIQ